MFQRAELRCLWSLSLHVKREELERRIPVDSRAVGKGLAGWSEDRKGTILQRWGPADLLRSAYSRLSHFSINFFSLLI